MSEMTDADVLRLYAGELVAVADRLEPMQWRDEPPDTDGDWVRKRGLFWQVFGVFSDTKTSRIHQPGDRWFKLPEDKR